MSLKLPLTSHGCEIYHDEGEYVGCTRNPVHAAEIVAKVNGCDEMKRLNELLNIRLSELDSRHPEYGAQLLASKERERVLREALEKQRTRLAAWFSFRDSTAFGSIVAARDEIDAALNGDAGKEE